MSGYNVGHYAAQQPSPHTHSGQNLERLIGLHISVLCPCQCMLHPRQAFTMYSLTVGCLVLVKDIDEIPVHEGVKPRRLSWVLEHRVHCITLVPPYWHVCCPPVACRV